MKKVFDLPEKTLIVVQFKPDWEKEYGPLYIGLVGKHHDLGKEKLTMIDLPFEIRESEDGWRLAARSLGLYENACYTVNIVSEDFAKEWVKSIRREYDKKCQIFDYTDVRELLSGVKRYNGKSIVNLPYLNI